MVTPAASLQPPVTVSDVTEAELVARIQNCLPPPPPWTIVGIGDDAAVVEPERNRLEVLSVDALIEGIHFDRAFTPPDAIGHRALAINLSDLAAMGASPRFALLSWALPGAWPLAEFEAAVKGLVTLARRHRVHVIGGNLARSPGPLMVDVTIAGTVKRRRPLLRSGARPGDVLYVSGTIGAAAAGLQMLKATTDGRFASARDEDCVRRYLYPEARVRLGLLLGRTGAATAAIDLSDGLADGARRIAEASGVGVAIDGDCLPIEPAARRWFESRHEDPIDAAISGGDDYELLVASAPRSRGRLAAAARAGTPLTAVGVCTGDRTLTVKRNRRDGGIDAQPLPQGYSHFR